MTRGRISYRDQLLANQASLDQYAALSGKPRHVIDIPPEPVKRAPRDPREPTEHEIQSAVYAALRMHPRVCFVGRFNSGGAVETNADGTQRHLRFNTVKGFSDLHGMLKGGRAFYIEIKSRKGRLTDDQALFIDRVLNGGGIAGVARSVEDALALIEGRA